MKKKNPKNLSKLRACIKEKDGWWASIFAGPVANRLLEPFCDVAWLTPNHLTFLSLFIGCLAAWFFLCADYFIGALLVQLSFVVDCMDGQFARYSKKFSDLGAWLDRICDRVKDFLYFFALAIGFYKKHGEHFEYGLTSFVNFLSNFVSEDVFFSIDSQLHMFTMQCFVIDTWLIFPLAMIAMFAVFLIDYYVNQDMKFPSQGRTQLGDSAKILQLDQEPALKKNNAFLAVMIPLLKFGLQVYKAIPILRFNIGEQALLLSFFTAFGAIYTGMVFFALLGTFYVFYWPIAKYYGFTEGK